MTEPTIPYASTVDRRGPKPRDIFGVIVRTIGLLMILWGIYCMLYLVNAHLIGGSGAYSTGNYLFVAGFYLAAGISMFKGEWLVDLAYGPSGD